MNDDDESNKIFLYFAQPEHRFRDVNNRINLSQHTPIFTFFIVSFCIFVKKILGVYIWKMHIDINSRLIPKSICITPHLILLNLQYLYGLIKWCQFHWYLEWLGRQDNAKIRNYTLSSQLNLQYERQHINAFIK